MLTGIDSGVNTRPAMVDYVRSLRRTGTGPQVQVGPNGELASALIWIYEVK